MPFPVYIVVEGGAFDAPLCALFDKKGLNFRNRSVIIRTQCRVRISVIQRLPKP